MRMVESLWHQTVEESATAGKKQITSYMVVGGRRSVWLSYDKRRHAAWFYRQHWSGIYAVLVQCSGGFTVSDGGIVLHMCTLNIWQHNSNFSTLFNIPGFDKVKSLSEERGSCLCLSGMWCCCSPEHRLCLHWHWHGIAMKHTLLIVVSAWSALQTCAPAGYQVFMV